jgi:deoxyadenosine/deoxycytidine kinase
MIIHISGVSGSGKTFLGNEIKQKFKNKVIVKDLDNLRDQFIKFYYKDKSWTYINEKQYQKYINTYVTKCSEKHKPIIFVGLNDNTVYGKNKKLYYNLHAQYKYFIDITDSLVIKQKCNRLLTDIQNDKAANNDLINNNKNFIKQFTKAVKRECNLSVTTKINQKWRMDYKKQGYVFLSRKGIYKRVSSLLTA